MKFVFVSNYLNHHQIPFCNAMYGLLKEEFAFIQTQPMEEERVRMGWQDSPQVPYLKLYYEMPAECQQWIDNCKAVLFGGTDDESYISERLRSGKPLIRYSERLYKTGQWKAVSPRGLMQKYKDHTRYRKAPIYMLCSGAYVPSDFHIVRAYPHKLLRWGYFPETRRYDVDKLMADKRQGSILWAARFIDWKHPELPLETARWLKEHKHDFHMDIVGGGEMEQTVKALLAEYKLEEYVTLLGYRTPEEVRGLMEKSDIYLTTSDRQEGWGAVVNEAMNSGCAVVADHMIGAVPFMIQHGRNGLIYKDGQKEELFALTGSLLRDRKLCQKLGRNAVKTVVQDWNAENAAGKLAELCIRLGFLDRGDVNFANEQGSAELQKTVKAQKMQENVRQQEAVQMQGLQDKDEIYAGPCSAAPVISERKMYARLMKEALRR